MDFCVVETPVGFLRLEADGAALTKVEFCAGPCAAPQSDLLRQAAQQLAEYFSGARRSFSVPLAPQGTPFQRAVWRALCDIPYGQTRSYGQIAAAVGNPRAARAVGMACNRNPIGIVIPCHRVVGANGALTGYAGGMDKKAALLALEREVPDT